MGLKNITVELVEESLVPQRSITFFFEGLSNKFTGYMNLGATKSEIADMLEQMAWIMRETEGFHGIHS